MNAPIFLDYNGTTPHAAEVIEAMLPYIHDKFGNPSSSHWYGADPRMAVDNARKQLALMLNCQVDEVLFTSGGTESNNQALKSIGGARYSFGNHIITSNIEHPAIYNVCAFMERHGFEITYVDVDEQGVVKVPDIVSAIKAETVLISIMHSNNEVGTLQPIGEIAQMIRGKSILFHTDAAQSLGKVVVDVDELGVDLLSIAGHKLYAPKGIGALFIRKGVNTEIFCHGASQEGGWRGGTENVTGIVGLGKACEVSGNSLHRDNEHMRAMRDRLEKGLVNNVKDIRFNGHRHKRLPNTASVSFLGVDANVLLEKIGSEIAASAGAACHSGEVNISHVLRAMKVPQEWARGTVRFSTGRMTTAQQIDRAVEVITAAVKSIRG